MDSLIKLKSKSNPINYFDTRAEATVEDRVIKGYLAIWGAKDSHNTIFIKGCCSKSIQERGPESNSNYKITLLWQHDIDNPIGRFTMLKEDDKGLYFEAEIDDVEDGNRALKQIKSGTLNQFSFGFRYIWDKVEYSEEQEAYIVKEIDLVEGSVVTIGSQELTHAIRSVEDLEKRVMNLKENLEIALKSIPRAKQIELRKSITDYISLLEQKPSFTFEKRAEKKEVDFELLINKI